MSIESAIDELININNLLIWCNDFLADTSISCIEQLAIDLNCSV